MKHMTTFSAHFLRRRARAKAHAMNAKHDGHRYSVERCVRGPFRYRVVRVRNHNRGTSHVQ